MRLRSPSRLMPSRKRLNVEEEIGPAPPNRSSRRPYAASSVSQTSLPHRPRNSTDIKDHVNKKGAVDKMTAKKNSTRLARRKSAGDTTTISSFFKTVTPREPRKAVQSRGGGKANGIFPGHAGEMPQNMAADQQSARDAVTAIRRSTRARVPSKKVKMRVEAHHEVSIEEVEEVESSEDDLPEEPTSHCPTAGDYSSPIYVYACLKNPERVAGYISTWEDHKNIDGVINNDSLPFYDWEGIPRDAIYIVLAEYMICNPFGTALFFATKTEDNRYALKVGFYYSYEKASDTCLHSLKEWCDEETMCGWPIMQCEEAIRAQVNWPRFKVLYESMERAVNVEMESRKTGPGLRNHYGKNRVRPFRKRAPVLCQ